MDRIFVNFCSRIRQIWTKFSLRSLVPNSSSSILVGTDFFKTQSSFPFAEHLGSNYIPSDAETLLIQASLIQASETLKRIRDEMLRLNKQVEILASKHEELAHQLAHWRSLITLPRRLPDDILREIFHHSLPTDLNPSLEIQSPPLIFTQVCSRWRQLAISTPTLWSSVHIPLVNEDYPPHRAACDQHVAAQAFHERRASASLKWLERSGSLTINVSLYGSKNPISPIFFNLYSKSLVPYSSRWRSLFLQAPGASLHKIAAIPSSDLRALESLFLHFERPPGDHPRPFTPSIWIESDLFMTPSLRKLSMLQDIFDPTAIRINWSLFTHLEIGGAPDPRFLRHSPFLTLCKASSILKSCPNLIHCSIELGPSWFEDDFDIPVMHLPVLRRLSIGERVDIEPFAEKLDLPMLEELNFRSINVQCREHSSCLSIVSRAGGTLRKLTIDSEFFSDRLFLESLRHCPNLASLTVGQRGRRRKDYERNEQDQRDEQNWHNERNEERIAKHFRIDDLLFERFARNDASSLCPRLEEFICGVDGYFTLTGLLEFLSIKQTIGPTLGLAKLKVLSIQRLPDRYNAFELNLPEISSILRPLVSDMKFRSQGDYLSRLESSKLVAADAADYGDSAVQYAEFWTG